MRNGQLLFLAKAWGEPLASIPQITASHSLRKGGRASKLLPGPTGPCLNQGRESNSDIARRASLRCNNPKPLCAIVIRGARETAGAHHSCRRRCIGGHFVPTPMPSDKLAKPLAIGTGRISRSRFAILMGEAMGFRVWVQTVARAPHIIRLASNHNDHLAKKRGSRREDAMGNDSRRSASSIALTRRDMLAGGAAMLAQLLGATGAIGFFWLLGRGVATRFRPVLYHLSMPIVTLLSLLIGYVVLQRPLAPVWDEAVSSIYTWCFLLGTCVCAVWLSMAVFSHAESLRKLLHDYHRAAAPAVDESAAAWARPREK